MRAVASSHVDGFLPAVIRPVFMRLFTGLSCAGLRLAQTMPRKGTAQLISPCLRKKRFSLKVYVNPQLATNILSSMINTFNI
jgi:hypothetical protein